MQANQSSTIIDKLSKLMAFKFQYMGEELYRNLDKFYAENFNFTDEEILKDLKKYKLNCSGEFIEVAIHLYESVPLKNCILGSAAFPFEMEGLTRKLIEWNENIEKYLSKYRILESAYMPYEKYKFPHVFTYYYDEELANDLCCDHPYFKLTKDIRRKNTETFYLDITNYVTKSNIDAFIEQKKLEKRNENVRKLYFEFIKYIDKDFYIKNKDSIENDPFYNIAENSHDSELCKICIQQGHLLDLEEFDSDDQEEYLETFGPYLPKDYRKHSDFFRWIKKSAWIAYIVGKNPHYQNIPKKFLKQKRRFKD